MADPTNEVHAPNQAASLSIREPEDKGNNLQLLGVNAGGPDAASSDNCSQEKPLVYSPSIPSYKMILLFSILVKVYSCCFFRLSFLLNQIKDHKFM